MSQENKEAGEVKQQGGSQEREHQEITHYPYTPENRPPRMPAPAAPLVYNDTDKLLLVGAALLGIIFVWLFYGKYPGVSVPLLVIAFYSLLLKYTGPILKKEAKFGWFLSIPVLMLSLTFCIFSNEILMVLNILVLPWLIILQTLLVTGSNSYKWYSLSIILDLLYSAFARCIIHIAKPFRMISSIVRGRIGTGRKKSVGSRVIIGLIISLPIVLILLLLLSSADMVFGKIVEGLPQFLESLSFEGVIPRIILFFFAFLVSFSYMWSLGHGEKCTGDLKAAENAPDGKKRWDPVIVITITAAIDVLYIFFVVIQFTYLFGRYGLPDGLTYSEYARNGFSELILVSLLNIGLLAMTLTYTRKAVSGADKVIRLLNTIMICCTLVMLCSAYYRMSLYETAYGFTFLRIMTQAFMIFLSVLFFITMARVWNDRLPLVKPYIAAAVIAFTVVNYINVDVMIAKNNIARYYETGQIDIEYFRDLSSSVVKEIKELASDKDPAIAFRAQKILDNKKSMLEDRTDWQSFNLADHFARKVLSQK